MRQAGMSLLIGLALALGIAALFRLAGPAFFFEGRAAANAHALFGALAGGAVGFAIGRLGGGLRGVLLAAVPGLLAMAAITSHFSLAFPDLPPALDKGFGGLILWFYGFWMIGGLAGARINTGRT